MLLRPGRKDPISFGKRKSQESLQMPTRWIAALRNHAHVLLIVPLVVIVMTWPTFPRIFDWDTYWLPSQNTADAWIMLWDAWHLGTAIAGQSELYYTDAMFYPRGVTLAFQLTSAPHAFVLLALQQALPADDAYKLYYLLTICFNAFCAYSLIVHLLKDKWIALYGAIAVGINPLFTDGNATPQLIMMGTLPLCLYFLHRSVTESRWRFAMLAGICAGVTAFILPYTFLILLLSGATYALFLSFSHWRKPRFWQSLALILAVCAVISALRFYPMLAEANLFDEAQSRYAQWRPGRDVLDYFVLSKNPIAGAFLHSVFKIETPDAHKLAYLGYINIFLLACAIFRKLPRRRLAPWLALFSVFAILRLGDYLVINGHAFPNIVLLEYVLSNLFPSTFGQVGGSQYYQVGIVTPLAVLSCFGLYDLFRTRQSQLRIAVVIMAAALLCVEYYLPHVGFTLEEEKTGYLDWLGTENESPIIVVNLPQGEQRPTYYAFAQSLSGYPNAYGWANRNRQSARTYVNRNYLLRAWRSHQPAVCLPLQNSSEYIAALDELLRDGFTHIVMHEWLAEEPDLSPSFAKVHAAYQNEYVSVYRLADMRQNCAPPPLPPAIDRFAHATFALPGNGSSIVSYHPNRSIEPDTFAYVGRLFSAWDSFHHLYRHDGEWVTQSAGPSAAERDVSAQNRRIVHLIYDVSDGPPRLPESIEFRDEFNLCQRDAYQGGAVIELYFNPQFSCALVTSDSSLRVEYDNGARLENLLYEVDQDLLDLQILWRNLPDKTHSLSVQLFDGAGNKVIGQDSVIGSRSITRHIVDLSVLPSGDYIAKLIFYRYSTGESVPGTVSGSGARFDRELEIATIRKT